MRECFQRSCLAVILGGGKGTRLYPLTKERSKPAVPFAGNYRIVDIPISNCLNSGINKVFVITQYNSASLNRHIVNTYRFDSFHEGFVDILASELTEEGMMGGFAEGTADAVRKAIKHLRVFRPSLVLVLAGDQLYRMDFSEVIATHVEKKAHITVCTFPVLAEEVGRFGILAVDEQGAIRDFVEKPSSEDILKKRGFCSEGGKYLASMGIYLFDAELLFRELLHNPQMNDFGKEVIPYLLQKYRCYSYRYEGYWEDIGTIVAYHAASLSLARKDPPFSLYDSMFPFFSRPRFLPPAQVVESQISEVLLSPGVQVICSEIRRSVVGVRARIAPGCSLEDTVVMGADFYEEEGLRPGIGKNCVIRNAIIDKNASIGDGSVLVNEKGVEHFRGENYTIVDGIVVVHKNARIEPGTRI
ncbi:MAG: sugar phosphate nucleotidyltransferase [Brevinematales bacterium]|nr:sugar phosphate nucleotidyltransferase [Brevinematales bacterium]